MIEGLAVIAMFIITGILVIIWQNNEDRIRDISFKRFIEKKYSKSKSEDGDYIFVDPEKNPEIYEEDGEQIGAETEDEESEMMFW